MVFDPLKKDAERINKALGNPTDPLKRDAQRIGKALGVPGLLLSIRSSVMREQRQAWEYGEEAAVMRLRRVLEDINGVVFAKKREG